MNLFRKLRHNNRIYILYRTLVMLYKRIFYGLKNVDATFFMSGSSKISKDFSAGAYSFIGDSCRICPKVSISHYVMIAPNVTITGSDHRFDIAGTPIIFSGRPILKSTIIEADVWVGYGSLIMSGVHVGRGAVIAANSVVTKDIPPYEVYGGVPAKKIKDRFESVKEMSRHDKMLQQPPQCGEFCSDLDRLG